jgi:peroxiredoxin
VTELPPPVRELARIAPDLAARGVQLVPILAQGAEPVRRYVEETGLPFNVLIDENRDVARAYAVWHRIALDAWNIARPAVFLIDGGQAALRLLSAT